MQKEKDDIKKSIISKIDMKQPIDDNLKAIYNKLEGKTFIEAEFTKENMKTRQLTKEAMDIVADYTKG